ncbi:MAG: stress response translation initiation inhibitor YciH [Acidobacteriota bacterium]
MSRQKSSRLVYSTEQPTPDARSSKPGGRRKPKAKPGGQHHPPADGIVRVWRQTKGRKGKGVTAITGLDLDSSALGQLARELKTLCGSGGTAKAGTIEIQGDHRDRVIDALRKRGWQVKKAGG